MIKNNDGLEVKTDSATGIGRCLTQRVVRPRLLKSLLLKEKHGATFATLQNSPVSSGMLTDAKSTRSNAYFRFVVAARADVLPTPANVQQWYQGQRTMCTSCGRDAKPTLAHILNGCTSHMAEMTQRHNKVVDVVRRVIIEKMKGRIHSPIGENVALHDEGLSEDVRRLRPDLNFVASEAGEQFTVLIDISCPFGRISYGESTLDKVSLDKRTKYRELASELRRIRRMKVAIIPVIVSSLGAVHGRTLEQLDQLLRGNVRETKALGRKLSGAAIMGSFRLWRRYMENRMRSGDQGSEPVIVRREMRLVEEEQERERVEQEQEQEEGNEELRAREGEDGEEVVEVRGEGDYDLSEELENEEADDEAEGREDVNDDGEGDRVAVEVEVEVDEQQDDWASVGADMRSFMGMEPH
jgi:hypothetical protein